MTGQQRTVLAGASLFVALIGITAKFGWEWAAILAGVLGIAVALTLALGAVR